MTEKPAPDVALVGELAGLITRCKVKLPYNDAEDELALFMCEHGDRILSALRTHDDGLEDAAKAGWLPIETCPLWEVAVVVDADLELAAIAQKAENDWGDVYWAVEPEDGLDWEPAYWQSLPSRNLKGKAKP